jgi:hypothetical protein
MLRKETQHKEIITAPLSMMLAVGLSYVFSSTKLEIRAEQVLPGSEGGSGGKGEGERQGGE